MGGQSDGTYPVTLAGYVDRRPRRFLFPFMPGPYSVGGGAGRIGSVAREGAGLLEVARGKMRVRHLAYRTEQTYLQWIRR